VLKVILLTTVPIKIR